MSVIKYDNTTNRQTNERTNQQIDTRFDGERQMRQHNDTIALMHPSPELIVVIWSLVVLLVLVALILGSLWAYKRWKKSCLHLDDFKKLSTEVQELSAKTAEVREDVDQDNTAAECIKITNQELLNAADEWDQGNLIALTAWEDFIQVQETISGEGGSKDLEKQQTQGDR
ncbi:hypothetical protein HYALB_00009884 [Hymenoscyphus albidus]|uniref:Uncharacterized protein n=1 Tax=Hymenoscyphus albidus TaxID=595503 RepID=A0A9N9QCW5_9HELO|nr:hypothetical protein HYALB_00009884 [Hymenoscyphus albidus]